MNGRLICVMIMAALCSGCASNYTTPGAGVSLTQIEDFDIREMYATTPAAAFPANIAIIRVQDAGYYTPSNRGYGRGRFTVVTTRDIESDESYERVSKLPLVAGIAPIGRLLLPAYTNSIKDLRMPAARLNADLLLIYSVDSTFDVDGKSLGPLSLVSLGFIRNKKAHVSATVAGVLVDVRTGFIYGTTEATAREVQRASVWSTEMAIESARMKAERSAFDDFVVEFQNLWSGVLNTHASTRPAAAPGIVDTDTNTWHRILLEN